MPARPHSPETKARLSAAARAQWADPTRREALAFRIRQAMADPETKAKVLAGQKARRERERADRIERYKVRMAARVAAHGGGQS